MCTQRHLTFAVLLGLCGGARDRGLFIQFYLNIDRFTDLFPRAGIADGTQHHFDIDYADPGYREFCRNYARRMAMALYPYDNVSTIVVWEEKIGVDVDFNPANPKVTALYASEAGKAGFEAWLKARHGNLKRLNAAWGTSCASFREAIDRALSEYLEGAPRDDHRQHDLLEYGEVLLIEFTEDFVEAYKEVDPTMPFQCRHFDLFGPVRPLHPGLSFLDSFGINNYTLGHRGPDFSFREEYAKVKLVAGVAGTAPYVGNFGFRSESHDGATHGLVKSEEMKAHFGADSVVAYSFIPEISGSSYFMYLCPGWEGPWGIVRDPGRERAAIFDAFRAVHTMMAEKNELIAQADYAAKPRVYVFHGLDAMFDLAPVGWIQNPELSFGLSEMNVNYGVITDTDAFEPGARPAILALFSTYERKLDAGLVRRLSDYARRGGTLVIANTFGATDRYLWPNRVTGRIARRLRGVDLREGAATHEDMRGYNGGLTPEGVAADVPIRGSRTPRMGTCAATTLKRGTVVVKGEGFPETTFDDTVYVEAVPDTFDPKAEVLLTMKAGEIEQPALIRRPHGNGTVYYLLFNPFRQEIWRADPKEDRASLPVLALLLKHMGVPFDSKLGNRGFDLANGRVNIHEDLSPHAFLSHAAKAAGRFKDEYGETNVIYSGGVITDDVLSFRGRELKERGWTVSTPLLTSTYAWTASNTLSFVTLDAADLQIGKDAFTAGERTAPYRVYRVPLAEKPE